MWEQIPRYINYVLTTYKSQWASVLLELLIIGIVVYSIMRFLRGTGGEKLIKGIVFLLLGIWGVGILAQKLNLDLDRIRLLSKYFLGAVLVVAAVAFQPELRRGLIRLGVTRFGRSAQPHLVQIIEQVVDATAYLSQTQIGALIAFERQVGLADLEAGGTPIDAEVTAQLLNTIFWPGSPLHDMAVIIRNDKLLAAGVQLPLAEHGDFDRLLGSRHRAAVGLSVQTDAVVVIVSEETGNIGLAVGGKLTRFLTLEQLRRQLIELVAPKAAKKITKTKKSDAVVSESSQKTITLDKTVNHEDDDDSKSKSLTEQTGQNVTK
ncbi:MAG: diadenylate cyclase [Planctomycetes bacterium]|nr:diadenylate cyclase [Planctomycetota bacterium]